MSNWTPPQSEWNPPNVVWTPPLSEWIPPPLWSPPVTDEPAIPLQGGGSAMDQLIEMGFADRGRNRQLLDKYHGDLQRVIQDLCGEDNDWHFNRH